MIIYDLMYHAEASKLDFDIYDDGREVESIEEYVLLRHRRLRNHGIKVFDTARAFCKHGDVAIYGKVYGIVENSNMHGHYFVYVVE